MGEEKRYKREMEKEKEMEEKERNTCTVGSHTTAFLL